LRQALVRRLELARGVEAAGRRHVRDGPRSLWARAAHARPLRGCKLPVTKMLPSASTWSPSPRRPADRVALAQRGGERRSALRDVPAAQVGSKLAKPMRGPHGAESRGSGSSRLGRRGNRLRAPCAGDVNEDQGVGDPGAIAHRAPEPAPSRCVRATRRSTVGRDGSVSGAVSGDSSPG
jgi:hypothetical protein